MYEVRIKPSLCCHPDGRLVLSQSAELEIDQLLRRFHLLASGFEVGSDLVGWRSTPGTLQLGPAKCRVASQDPYYLRTNIDPHLPISRISMSRSRMSSNVMVKARSTSGPDGRQV